MSQLPSYVVVTPARNEVQFLEGTLRSVVAQTVRPLRWVIVSDGSTDGTDELVESYAAQHDWIRLLRMPERRERNFAGKAYAVKAGVEQMQDLAYEAVASLDADLTFDENYFLYLLEKLASDAQLGIVGTPYQELTGEVFDYRFVSPNHVSGACQLFRRACYEQIGGYTPLKLGTIDNVAVISARMKGWKTRTFTDKVSLHHRKVGTAQHSAYQAHFRHGMMDYAMGNHPLWQIFRVFYQMTRPPRLLRGLAIGAGYFSHLFKRTERSVSPEFVAFVRQEQMERLRRKLLFQ